MMKTEKTISLDNGRLLPGTALEGDILRLPRAGGGFLIPEIREDGLRWLNMKITVLADHAQAFELRVYGTEEQPRVIIRFGLFPRFPAEVALDLAWLDGHILFPGHRVGCQKVVCHGSRIDRSEISRAEWVSMPCFKDIQVRVERAELTVEPREAVLDCQEKLIDRFGQYSRKDWPRKVTGEADLIRYLLQEKSKEAAYPDPAWNRWGGDTRIRLTEGTGYFGKVKKDGRWFLTDPEGCAFFSMGADCVAARADARIDGLEALLEDLPSPDSAEGVGLYSPMRENWGETKRPGGKLFSYERWNLRRAFGSGWETAWQLMVTGQLMRMGMNTLGNWSDERLYGRMPYVTSLPEFPGTAHRIFRDFPDVLSTEYREQAELCAQALQVRRNDPWMIGYFLRNEPAWAFVDGLIIAEEVLRDPKETACKTELISFLRKKYRTVDRLNQAWHTGYSDFDDLKMPVENAAAFSEAAREDLRSFSAVLTEAYVQIPAEACRAVDPHHMILGMRWAWISDPLLVRGWEHFDVFSINCYAVDPTSALNHVRSLDVDLPVMIGEFHFGALDDGLPATGLEAVSNQKERGKAYRFYCERVAAHPMGVGCHWFQCYDQFALGRFDGENYNIGLFDITMRPYPEMENSVRASALAVYGILSGRETPYAEKPESIPMIAY